MTQSTSQSRRSKVREEANKAAEQIERSLPKGMTPEALAKSMQMGTNAMSHWIETGQDLAIFYRERLAKDVSFMNDFATCRTPTDVARVWCRAASEAVHDYADQFDRVMAINMDDTALKTAGKRT